MLSSLAVCVRTPQPYYSTAMPREPTYLFLKTNRANARARTSTVGSTAETMTEAFLSPPVVGATGALFGKEGAVNGGGAGGLGRGLFRDP